MPYEITSKLDELKDYLSINGKDKYSDELNICIDNGFWDLACVVVWKYIMLFIYEKLNQISHEIVIDKWDSKFNRSNGKSLKDEVHLSNFYWPNNKKDDEILTLLGEVYSLHPNIIKQAKTLLNDRNICAHVSDIEPTEWEFQSFIEKSLRLINQVQINHRQYLLDFVITNGSNNLSQQDRDSIIDYYIQSLIMSDTFDMAEKYEKRLEPFLKYFNESRLKKLLNGILKSAGRPNQVMDAFYTIGFLERLASKTYSHITLWSEFCNNLKKFGYDEPKFEAFTKYIEGTAPF